MKSSIKIIKRKQEEDSNNLKTPGIEKSVEISTSEMVTTVKSWIAELQQRKRAQRRSLSDLTVTATAAVSQST